MNNILCALLKKNRGAIIICGILLIGWANAPEALAQGIETYLNRLAARSVSTVLQSPGTEKGIDPGKAMDKLLTLEACVRIALDKNPLIRAAQEGIAAAKEGVGEAKAPYYPDLALNAGYSRWQKHGFLPSGFIRPGASSLIGPTDDWAAGMKARYIIFDSGERQAKLRAANAGKGLAEEEAVRVRLDIVLDVHLSYYSFVSALENQSVAREQLARAEDHLRLARERKAAGVVSKVDVVRAQVGVGDAQLALVRAENLIRIFRGNLNTSMGLPVEFPIEVEAQPGEVKPPDDTDISKAFDQAIHGRPELKAYLKRIETVRSSVEGARSAYGPKIKAEAGYGWRDKDFLPRDEEWLAGVTIDLPLFTGFARKHRLARTKADLSKEEAEMERMIQKVRQEVWTAHSKLKETYQAVKTAEIIIQDAMESHRLARERYKVGAGTITDLLDAETALARTEANLASAQWDYHIARAVFQRSTGSLISDEAVKFIR